jgi:hypothetical protein
LKGFASNEIPEKRNGWQRFACQPFCLSAPKGHRRYHASLAVPAASVPTATMKPAAATVKAATTTMEATTAVEAATAVEATFTAESTAVETLPMKAAIKAAATVETPTKATATIEAAVKAAITIKETITIPEAKAPPRSGADEDAAIEPFRAVIAVGSAGVGIVVVISIATGWWAVIGRRSKSNAEGDALGVRVRSREETDAESNAE